MAMVKAAATPNGASTTAKPSLHSPAIKAARRAEAQQLIAAAKTRLVAVQQRLQAQERAAVAAGDSLGEERRVLASADALVRAAAGNQQLHPQSRAAAAASTLASQVAAGAARADRAAALAAAAAMGEAESQRRLLAHLCCQLEAVQLEDAPLVPAAGTGSPAPVQPAPNRRKGWNPLRRLLAPVAPLMTALAGGERQQPV